MSARPADSARPTFAPWQVGLWLAALIVASYPQVIFGLASFAARDFGFFAYPLAEFQRDCFWRGEWPLWDPYNNCGVPFLAQWNTMPLYPPSLLYLVLPLEWSLSCFSLLHLWWAGLGMYFLARRWTGDAFAAAFAGTAFAFSGFTLNLLMWPSHMATFSWLPWVVLTAEAAWRQGGKRIPLAAGVGALQMLAGGPETILLTWLLVTALWVTDWRQPNLPRGALLWRYPLLIALVAALAAMQLLPFLQLVGQAQREAGFTDLRWSMPASGWANFLVPMAFGTTGAEGIFLQRGQGWTSSYYLGLGTLWLALLAVRQGAVARFRRRAKPVNPAPAPSVPAAGLEPRRVPIGLLVGFAAAGLLCALGEHTPVYPALRKLVPQLGFVTYPVKYVLLAVFAAPLLAAWALAHFPNRADREAPPVQPTLWQGGVLLGLIGAITLWTQLASQPGDNVPAALHSGISRAAILGLTGLALGLLARRGTAAWQPLLPMGLLLLTWADVLTHEPPQNPTVPPWVYQRNLVRDRLAMNPQPALGQSRVMLAPDRALDLYHFAAQDSTTNLLAKRTAFCANINQLDQVPKVDGFFSLTPRDFDNFLGFVYAVTNANWAGLEDFLGVSQYNSGTNLLDWQPRPHYRPLVTAGQRAIAADDSYTLWALAQPQFDPEATVFLPREAASTAGSITPGSARVNLTHVGNQTVDFSVDCAAPAVAVIAQTYYPNWRAEIDGQPAPLLRANVAFQAVALPAGTHQVHLGYRDRTWECGMAISLCMWVNCLVSYVALRRRDLPATPARTGAAAG